MGDLLLTGLSGLNAFRNVLNTTGHNIANATTEGYSRQRVELDTRNPQLSGGGYVGSGVQSTTVSRSYDTFLATQFRSSSSATADLDSYVNLASQINNVLANPNIGLSVSLQQFFNAAQDVADDPTSIPARQVLLSEGEVIQNRINNLDQLFTDITSQINNSLDNTVADINSLAGGIATLNEQIVIAVGIGGGNQPNDLLDQRDKLIDDLSAKTSVTTSVQDDGSVNVFVGSGQSLVLGNVANKLATQGSASDPSVKDIVFKQTSGSLIVTNFMSGGELGGTLRFRDEILATSINNLGETAIALSAAVNQVHTNGVDLNGEQGQTFFNEPSVTVTATTGVTNTGTLGVTFDPATTAELTGSGYTVKITAGVNPGDLVYAITSSPGGSAIADGVLPAGDVIAAGLVFDLSGAEVDDSYEVKPPLVKDAAGAFSLGISDPREVAAALPVVSALTTSNTGSAKLSDMSISNLSSGTLPSTITLTFDDTTNKYNFSYPTPATITLGVSGPTTGSIDPYINGGKVEIDVPDFGTIKFTLTGVPKDGDTITLANNAEGVGDNRNANLLADLQTALTMSGKTATFQDSYGQLIADVGRRTQAAEANGLAQNALLTQAISAKDTISGVSLDEEAANLIRFQQAYQAASQVVLTSRTIFDTLLGAFR